MLAGIGLIIKQRRAQLLLRWPCNVAQVELLLSSEWYLFSVHLFLLRVACNLTAEMNAEYFQWVSSVLIKLNFPQLKLVWVAMAQIIC